MLWICAGFVQCCCCCCCCACVKRTVAWMSWLRSLFNFCCIQTRARCIRKWLAYASVFVTAWNARGVLTRPGPIVTIAHQKSVTFLHTSTVVSASICVLRFCYMHVAVGNNKTMTTTTTTGSWHHQRQTTTVGGLLIPLQLLLQLNGVGYPCLLSLIQSWFFLPLWGAPFALRSLRVIIATNKGESGIRQGNDRLVLL